MEVQVVVVVDQILVHILPLQEQVILLQLILLKVIPEEKDRMEEIQEEQVVVALELQLLILQQLHQVHLAEVLEYLQKFLVER